MKKNSAEIHALKSDMRAMKSDMRALKKTQRDHIKNVNNVLERWSSLHKRRDEQHRLILEDEVFERIIRGDYLTQMAGGHLNSNVFLGFNDLVMDTGRTSTDGTCVLTESQKQALKKNGLGYRKLHLPSLLFGLTFSVSKQSQISYESTFPLRMSRFLLPLVSQAVRLNPRTKPIWHEWHSAVLLMHKKPSLCNAFGDSMVWFCGSTAMPSSILSHQRQVPSAFSTRLGIV